MGSTQSRRAKRSLAGYLAAAAGTVALVAGCLALGAPSALADDNGGGSADVTFSQPQQNDDKNKCESGKLYSSETKRCEDEGKKDDDCRNKDNRVSSLNGRESDKKKCGDDGENGDDCRNRGDQESSVSGREGDKKNCGDDGEHDGKDKCASYETPTSANSDQGREHCIKVTISTDPFVVCSAGVPMTLIGVGSAWYEDGNEKSQARAEKRAGELAGEDLTTQKNALPEGYTEGTCPLPTTVERGGPTPVIDYCPTVEGVQWENYDCNTGVVSAAEAVAPVTVAAPEAATVPEAPIVVAAPEPATVPAAEPVSVPQAATIPTAVPAGDGSSDKGGPNTGLLILALVATGVCFIATGRLVATRNR